MLQLILKRAPIGDNLDDFDVLENGIVVGRIFKVPVAPRDRPWMWASGHSADSVKRAAHGYEATREAAMAAFAKSWRGEWGQTAQPRRPLSPHRSRKSLNWCANIALQAQPSARPRRTPFSNLYFVQ
jgi:hypothetical protein